MPQTQLPDPTDVLVGERVRERRKEIGVRQKELAAQLELSYQQVQKYEKGLNRIGASRLGRIAELLRVDASYFFDRTEDPSNADRFDASAFLSDRGGFSLARSFMQIDDPKLRKCLVDLAAGMAAQSEKLRALADPED